MLEPSKYFAGSKQITVQDSEENISFPVLIQYPTLQESSPTSFGPITMDVAQDATIADGKFPLVLLSHGNSGSHLIYHTITTFLAKRGFIVAMVEHFGNNRNNNQLEKSIKNLEYRPKHISLTIDKLLEKASFKAYIDSDNIAVIGHSFGGYTALAVAGGTPWTRQGQQVKVSKDSRVKAIILLTPATPWFTPENALENVKLPILMLTAEHDEYTPQWHSEIVTKGIPKETDLTFQIIKNAGHFSFISPFPANMSGPQFLPSTDPKGFNRQEFHKQLPATIFNFLNTNLIPHNIMTS